MVVAQSTQRTRLGDELGLLWELLVAKTRDVGIGLTDELVAQTDLVEYAVVHGDDELVGRGPAHVVDIGQTRIVPAACGLVGGKALHVPQCTHVLAETAVDARDVGIAVGAVRRRTCQTLIALGKQLLIGVLRAEHLCGELDVGIDRRDVQIVHARACAEREGRSESHQQNFISFHNFNAV